MSEDSVSGQDDLWPVVQVRAMPLVRDVSVSEDGMWTVRIRDERPVFICWDSGGGFPRGLALVVADETRDALLIGVDEEPPVPLSAGEVREVRDWLQSEESDGYPASMYAKTQLAKVLRAGVPA